MNWDELVAAALIGTDRRPVEAVAPPGAPPELDRALERRGAEDRLLASAAAWAVARRAGARAADRVEVQPAAPDERPPCSRAAGDRLAMLLDEEEDVLVAQWLERAGERGLRPPPEHAPALLELAARRQAVQEAVTHALGPLAAWLAEREPRWAFAGAGEPEEVWTAGTRAQRRLLLARLRRSDPPAARALVESTFAEEPWEDREAFVEALAANLSDADEPFLDAALADPRQPVRDAAAHLLARLPGSRHAERVAAEAKPLLRAEDGVLKVALPAARARRAERLTELLAAAPLTTWELSWVDLPVADDLAPAVHRGWAGAALAQRDEAWARALWRTTGDPALLAILPRPEAERRAAKAEDAFAAALALPGAWGPTLSRKVIETVPARKERGLPVSAAAYRLDPSLADEVEALRDLGGRDVLNLCDIVATRAAMLRELS